jgi:hypothetical protein
MRQLIIIFLLLAGCTIMTPAPPTPFIQHVSEEYEYCNPPEIICDVGLECWHLDYWKGDTNFCSPECNTNIDCWYGFWCAGGYVNNHCMPW